jgi:hypothetical protein
MDLYRDNVLYTHTREFLYTFFMPYSVRSLGPDLHKTKRFCNHEVISLLPSLAF